MAAQASAVDERLDGWVPSLDHATFVDWNHVYEPSEDTFLLLDALFADRAALRASRAIVEIGPGSGVVSTYLAKLTHNNVLAVDVNEAACALTTRTAAANGARVNVMVAADEWLMGTVVQIDADAGGAGADADADADAAPEAVSASSSSALSSFSRRSSRRSAAATRVSARCRCWWRSSQRSH